MIKARKFLTAGLVAAVFAAGIAADTSALARGRGGGGGRGGFGHGGFGHGGFGGAGVGRAGWGHAGWGHAGWGRGGWGRRGYGYAGYGGWGYGGGWGYDDGWGWPDWGYDGYDYGVAGAALGVATLGAIAAGAAEQNQVPTTAIREPNIIVPALPFPERGAPASDTNGTRCKAMWRCAGLADELIRTAAERFAARNATRRTSPRSRGEGFALAFLDVECGGGPTFSRSREKVSLL